jgi:hypothetical protein
MTTRSIKTFYFVLAALNTLATTWFLNYLFFYLHDKFGFDNRQTCGSPQFMASSIYLPPGNAGNLRSVAVFSRASSWALAAWRL